MNVCVCWEAHGECSIESLSLCLGDGIRGEVLWVRSALQGCWATLHNVQTLSKMG